jgi:hypothetical protein
MQIEIEQWQHSGGTVEVSCKVNVPYKDVYLTDEYIVTKLKRSYYFEVVESKTLPIISLNYKIFIEDLVEDPKNLSDLDWQLLKITNPDVETYQWKIFKLLKDLLDNKESQGYITDKVKEVLNKHEI